MQTFNLLNVGANYGQTHKICCGSDIIAFTYLVMRNTIAYTTQKSASHSRGIPCSHKRGNDDRVTAV
jgi:hypothetical protein